MESVGEGVTNVKEGDHVIPLYTAGKPFHIRYFITHLNSRLLVQNAGNASFARAARPTFVEKVGLVHAVGSRVYCTTRY